MKNRFPTWWTILMFGLLAAISYIDRRQTAVLSQRIERLERLIGK